MHESTHENNVTLIFISTIVRCAVTHLLTHSLDNAPQIWKTLLQKVLQLTGDMTADLL